MHAGFLTVAALYEGVNQLDKSTKSSIGSHLVAFLLNIAEGAN